MLLLTYAASVYNLHAFEMRITQLDIDSVFAVGDGSVTLEYAVVDSKYRIGLLNSVQLIAVEHQFRCNPECDLRKQIIWTRLCDLLCVGYGKSYRVLLEYSFDYQNNRGYVSTLSKGEDVAVVAQLTNDDISHAQLLELVNKSRELFNLYCDSTETFELTLSLNPYLGSHESWRGVIHTATCSVFFDLRKSGDAIIIERDRLTD